MIGVVMSLDAGRLDANRLLLVRIVTIYIESPIIYQITSLIK